MLSNPSLYNRHRSMQEHDTNRFLSSVVSRMDWTRQSEDVMMDVGCGPGSSTLHLLLPFFPDVRRIIAVDVLPDMIEYAKKEKTHPKIEYHVANIEDSSTIRLWTGQINKVISVYCFNWLKHQREAFQNIYDLLKPGGEAALLFVTTTPYWDSYDAHINNPKWNKYLKNVEQHIPESHFKKHGSSYYNQTLRDIGFSVVVCEEENREYAYPDDIDCRAASASRSALTNHIPDELKEEFKNDLFQGFLKHNGRNSEGKPVLYYTTLTLLLRKLKE